VNTVNTIVASPGHFGDLAGFRVYRHLAEKRAENGKNMAATPTQTPTASDLLAHPDVVDAMAEAWADSLVNDP
jgi:hypothetical protein